MIMALELLLTSPSSLRLIVVFMQLFVVSTHGADGLLVDEFPGYSLRHDAAMLNNLYSVKYEDSAVLHSSRIKRQASSQGTATPPSMIIDEDGSHQYYNSWYFSGDTNKYYIDLETEASFTVIPHTALSGSHLTAAVVELPFTFTFYGHNVTKAYIATGGFLSLSTFFHEYISATQYVAPLMGNFDPSINDSATIRYANNGTAFTVEWNGIHIHHSISAGSFTFQTTLMKDGRIIFAYKHVPTSPLGIGGGNGHKVTVGVSDGYYIDVPLQEGSAVIQRHIYRYHTVDLDKRLVLDGSAFVLTPLPTCNQQSQSCAMCLGNKLPDFDCGWCSALKTCSSGFDRNRQEWLEAHCDDEKYLDVAHCSVEPKTTLRTDDLSQNSLTKGLSAGAWIGIMLGIMVLIAVIGLVVWLRYSYTHPTSNSGLYLIEFRHFFKKDSTRHVNNEDRYAVSISGDIHSNVEANGSTERSGDGPLSGQSPAPLPKEKVSDTSLAAAAGDVLPIPVNTSSVVQANTHMSDPSPQNDDSQILSKLRF